MLRVQAWPVWPREVTPGERCSKIMSSRFTRRLSTQPRSTTRGGGTESVAAQAGRIAALDEVVGHEGPSVPQGAREGSAET